MPRPLPERLARRRKVHDEFRAAVRHNALDGAVVRFERPEAVDEGSGFDAGLKFAIEHEKRRWRPASVVWQLRLIKRFLRAVRPVAAPIQQFRIPERSEGR